MAGVPILLSCFLKQRRVCDTLWEGAHRKKVKAGNPDKDSLDATPLIGLSPNDRIICPIPAENLAIYLSMVINQCLSPKYGNAS